MSNLWINWRILWWRIQIGPDAPWVRVCWHVAIHDSCGCVFCDVGNDPVIHDGAIMHKIWRDEAVYVPCALYR